MQAVIDFKNPDYTEVYKERTQRLAYIRKSPENYKLFIRHYRRNAIDFIEDWLNTYDPRRKKDADIPFLLFPKQKEYIRWLQARLNGEEDAIVEKSRDMGATWLSIAFAIWMWIFGRGSRVGFGSRKSDYVDKIGDLKSIFEKARFAIRHLPPELLPNGYIEIKHALFMRILNPENGNAIVGESGDNVGRGDRTTIYFKDESAFWEHQEAAESALSQTTNCVIDISTFNGIGNLYYRKWVAGKYPIFVFDWHDDPRKDQAWYEKQKIKYSHDPKVIAQEIDRDPHKSVSNIFLPYDWIMAAVNIELKPEGAIWGGLDVADEEGEDTNVLAIMHGNVLLPRIEEWNGVDTTITTRMAMNIGEEEKAEFINFDSIGTGAGVRGESKQLKTKIKFNPVNVGWATTENQIYDDKPNSDKFGNLKAELWWRLRMRFEKTYRYMYGDKSEKEKIDKDTLISLPNDLKLIRELSQPKIIYKENGKIYVESKKDMKSRGVKSPNRADAVVMLLYVPKIIYTGHFKIKGI